MNDILDKLKKLALNRLTTRLKHLRGKHDQLDHAWNRGMGQGGYGAGLAENQMGPLPTTDFYRQRLTDLTEQRRRGEITRAEMRQQMRDLRGIVRDENNPVKLINIIESPTRSDNSDPIQRIIDTELAPISQQIERLRQEQLDLAAKQKEKIDAIDENITNEAKFSILPALTNDFFNKIEEELQTSGASAESAALIANTKQAIDPMLNSNDARQWKNIVSEINTLRLTDSLFHEIRKASGFYSEFFGNMIDGNFGSLAGILLFNLKEYPNDFSNPTALYDVVNDAIALYRKNELEIKKYIMDEVGPERKQLQRKIDELTIDYKDASRKIPGIKRTMIDSGEAVVTQLYDDPISRRYFDAELIPEDTKAYIDVHKELRSALDNVTPEPENSYAKIPIIQNYDAKMFFDDMGIDIDNPKDVQLIGDLLGAFSDGTPNSRFRIELKYGLNGPSSVHIDSFMDIFDADTNKRKSLRVNRHFYIEERTNSIGIINDFFDQKNMGGMGRAALTRQIPAAIKFSNKIGKKVRIHAQAHSNGSDMVGYHVWPKMSFNFEIPADVRNILDYLGYDSYDYPDTFSLMTSDKTAQSDLNQYKQFNGKKPIEFWSDVVELALQDDIDNEFLVPGEATIEAIDASEEPYLDGVMLEYYNDYLRQKLRSKTKSVKNKRYEQYLESQGFSMEDIEAFEYAWAMARKRGIIK